SVADLRTALAQARASARTTVVHIEVDPFAGGPSSEAWWDVPVAEVAALDTTRAARASYQQGRQAQRRFL
ncbi:MAG: 3D-(3,5/4)-trihydroxycyclohexane-1,2-dione acylhydrolase (decyclizing), partial [Streptomycetales bacterium]